MGEKERGKPDLVQEPQLQPSTPASSTTSSSMTMCSMANHTAAPINGLVVRPNSNGKPEDPARPVALGWQTAWRFIYEKWRLCAFIALAVVVSRFSTMGWTVMEGYPFSFLVRFLRPWPFLIVSSFFLFFFSIFRSLSLLQQGPIDLYFTTSSLRDSHILDITHQSNSRLPLFYPSLGG